MVNKVLQNLTAILIWYIFDAWGNIMIYMILFFSYRICTMRWIPFLFVDMVSFEKVMAQSAATDSFAAIGLGLTCVLI